MIEREISRYEVILVFVIIIVFSLVALPQYKDYLLRQKLESVFSSMLKNQSLVINSFTDDGQWSNPTSKQRAEALLSANKYVAASNLSFANKQLIAIVTLGGIQDTALDGKQIRFNLSDDSHMLRLACRSAERQHIPMALLPHPCR